MDNILRKAGWTVIIYLVTGTVLALLLAVVRVSEGLTFFDAATENLIIFFTFDYGGTAVQIARSRWELLLFSSRLTLMLILGAIGCILAVGVTSGVAGALYPGSRVLRGWGQVLSVLSSFPALVVGILVIFLVSRTLGLVPFYDFREAAGWIGRVAIYALPMAALAMGDGALSEVMHLSERTTRSLLRSDYIRAVQARGIPIRRHVIRGIALSVTASLSSKGAYFVGGAVVVEYLFGWPGLGFQMIDTVTSAGEKDIKLILAATLIFIGFVIAFTMINDVIRYYAMPQQRAGIGE